MKNKINLAASCVAIAPLLLACAPSFANTKVTMGDGAISGEKIAPYSLTWRQCAVQDGEWKDGGPLTEEAVLIGENVLRIMQRSKGPGGRTAKSSVYFERQSMAPLRMEQEIAGPDGKVAMRRIHLLDENGYQAITESGDKVVNSSGNANTQMFHGGALGLPLATLDYDNAPFSFDASMIAFDATYQIVATVAGEDQIPFEGDFVDIIRVDVEWRPNELGDVYPPGPDASGGQYWIAQDPPPGFPYVPRYKTDTYAVEFLPQTCPDDAAPNE